MLPVPNEPSPIAAPRVDDPDKADETYRQGLEVQALTQFQLIRRRFFRHRLALGALAVLAIIIVISFFSSRFAVYDFRADDPRGGGSAAGANYPKVARPSYAHPFGRDQLGRDVYARILEGTRQSVRVGLGVALFSSVIGTMLGGIAGYYRGWIDNLLMRFTDLIITIPLLAALLVFAKFGEKVPLVGGIVGKKDANAVLVILSLFVWTPIARLVRGQFLSLREKEYVESARALGASDARIMVKHLLPNAAGPIIVQTTLIVASAILAETALSFLGFGIQPPATSLGRMITDARDAFQFTPWEIWFPGLMIVVICLCINFVGDGLRDALDPTGKKMKA